MSKKFTFLFAGLLLVACIGKQPTEIQKAQIERTLLECLSSLTTQIGIKETQHDLLGSLANFGDMITKDISKKSWRISSDPEEIITMSFKAEGTHYDCDYVENATKLSGWTLIEVRRNSEVVFNLKGDLAAKRENKKLLEENPTLNAISEMRENMSLFVSPTLVLEQSIRAGARFRLGGVVAPASFSRTGDDLEVQFIITDGFKSIDVSYKGILPDQFSENLSIVAVGSLTPQGRFVAEKILVSDE